MKKTNVVLSVLAALIMLAILLNPARYVKSASDGLLVFALNVLPALFPFMFLTRILTELGTLGAMTNRLSPFFRRVFRVPASGGYIFLMSLLSGYPVGAKLISEFYERGEISEAECARMSAFCSTSGPLFVLGTVGTGMLFSLPAGAVVFAAHLLGAAANGLIFRNYRKKSPPSPPFRPERLSNPNLLYDSIYGSVTSVLIVGGYITLFYVAIDILNDYNALLPVKTLLGKLLTAFHLPAHAGEGAANGLIEATRGCLDLSRMGLPLPAATVLCCAVISFGGLSIFMQQLTFLAKCKVKAGFLLAAKACQTLLSAAFCIPLSLLL